MIESLHSPHIARVKALISSRGNKERGEHGEFIAEGLQCAREALAAPSGPKIKNIYLTESGLSRLGTAGLDTAGVETLMVSEPVMAAMSSTITPQGILSVCEIGRTEFADFKLNGNSKLIYLHEIQDPGNAGTILRSADAMGVDAVITSPGSVDMYSPKVVRATAGSLWHVPLYSGVTLSTIARQFPQLKKLALDANGDTPLTELKNLGDCIAIFGNEARGIDTLIDGDVIKVNIPMKGNAESLNLSAAASIVMFYLAAL
jgi:RNA methyltransferase, TrmH family